jgi:hypothetical protein
MFFRTKKSGPRTYLQFVENHWRDRRPQQADLATLDRLDELQERETVDGVLRSGARFDEQRGSTRLVPLCTKDHIEEGLVQRRRDLSPICRARSKHE